MSQTKKWTKPIIAAHDLKDLEAGSVTVINTSSEQKIACQLDEEAKLLPATRGRVSYRPTIEGRRTAVRVVMVSPFAAKDSYTKKPSAFMDKYIPVSSKDRVVVFVYSVTPTESPKGASYFRATLDS